MARRIFPISAFPATEGNSFPYAYRPSNGRWIEGLGAAASLSSDAKFDTLFWTPDPLPAGTAKLCLWTLTNGTGNAQINPKWKSYAPGESMNDADGSLNAEGTTQLAVSAGDASDFLETKINLDADTIVAGEFIIIAIVLESSSWTLNARSLWIPSIVWE